MQALRIRTVGCCSNTGWEDRAFVFIRYLHPDETQPEVRKRSTKWADLYEAKAREPSRTSSMLGSPLLQKQKFAAWPLTKLLTIV